MKIIYYCGRFLQVLSLAIMPFSIWVGHFGHNERGAIIIFMGALVIFFLGWICVQIFNYYTN